MKKKTILFTGGGTAGHVLPHFSLFPKLLKNNIKIHYIGSYTGIEKSLIQQQNIPYTSILTGKLRRYISARTFVDFFSFSCGLIQAFFYLFWIRPKIVFSKGGYVSVPVVLAAFLHRIPIMIHESDLTMGLANRISSLFATHVFFTFEESLQFFKKNKKKYQAIGSLIRDEIFQGDTKKGLNLCNWSFEKKIKTLLIVGGSLGSKNINYNIEAILPDFHQQQWRAIHICGKGKTNPKIQNSSHYCSFEFVNQQFKDLLSISDIVISRAGSGSIFELLALQKPNLLIPLSKKASRGDQILNAQIFKQKGYSLVLQEEELSKEKLLSTLQQLWENKIDYQKKMKQHRTDGTQVILKLFFDTLK